VSLPIPIDIIIITGIDLLADGEDEGISGGFRVGVTCAVQVTHGQVHHTTVGP